MSTILQRLNDPLPRAARGALGLAILVAATNGLAGWPQLIVQIIGLGMLVSGVGGLCPLASGGACAAPIPRPAAPDTAREGEMGRLHAQALGRDYDLRTCNPAHGPFYGAMARYKDHADDPAALRELADSLAPFVSGERGPQDLRESYRQLAEMARWRADTLEQL
ncbi:DUF2892 domain-containing protein [Oscillochloris sp. ZM17-4]|uniref:YgaP family membrane protein n=1 Tax=Oscillochloris sp. ZM17-4 TaxID=2866714 RepID=UPI001C72F4C7|nr:DUF2892 domain-containing protein [Oscillochloris sp. ZM17-4]MBX0329008.1 DUF2892 domain-containing protein [Oscillochloris sp. ZM17-4]